MTRKIVTPSPASAKDSEGAYIKPPEPEKPSTPSEVSIDDEMTKGLLAIHRLMKMTNESIVARNYTKDTVLILKALMDMLKDLKKSEDDLLDEMSTAELQELLDKRNKP